MPANATCYRTAGDLVLCSLSCSVSNTSDVPRTQSLKTWCRVCVSLLSAFFLIQIQEVSFLSLICRTVDTLLGRAFCTNSPSAAESSSDNVRPGLLPHVRCLMSTQQVGVFISIFSTADHQKNSTQLPHCQNVCFYYDESLRHEMHL